MSAYFDIYADPPQADGRVSVHPRLVNSPYFTTEHLISSQTTACTLTRADIEATLSAFSDYLLFQLQQGGSVHMNRIGSFRVVPQFKTKKFLGDRITGKDVIFKRIIFTPSRQLLQQLSKSLSFVHHDGRHSDTVNEAQAVLLLREYFQDHNNITLRQFSSLCGLTQTQSRRLIRGLVEKQRLTRRRVGPAFLYEPNPYYLPQTSSPVTNTPTEL